MTTVVLIDYDNLSKIHKTKGVLDVVTRALSQVNFTTAETSRWRCEVRVYGGWYEDQVITRAAQDLVVELRRDFPAIIRVPRLSGSVIAIETSAVTAFSMLEDPSNHLFHTYRRKARPSNIRVKSQSDVRCTKTGCPLPALKRLIRKGRCLVASCANSDLLSRSEQKLVDTMLTCDLIYCAGRGYSHVAVVSGDDDFLPPIRTLVLRNENVYRFYPNGRPNGTHYDPLKYKLIEMEL